MVDLLDVLAVDELDDKPVVIGDKISLVGTPLRLLLGKCVLKSQCQSCAPCIAQQQKTDQIINRANIKSLSQILKNHWAIFFEFISTWHIFPMKYGQRHYRAYP